VILVAGPRLSEARCTRRTGAVGERSLGGRSGVAGARGVPICRAARFGVGPAQILNPGRGLNIGVSQAQLRWSGLPGAEVLGRACLAFETAEHRVALAGWDACRATRSQLVERWLRRRTSSPLDAVDSLVPCRPASAASIDERGTSTGVACLPYLGCSLAQRLEQPSPDRRLPSSHASVP
jgi:hypothetical protein